MKLRFTGKADQDYAALPVAIRKALGKPLAFLLVNRSHPSLRSKKYSESLNIWQGRVTRDWRFYFTIQGDDRRPFLCEPDMYIRHAKECIEQ